MLTPERVVDALGQDLAAERYGPLSVYWLKVRKSREQFANQVRECRNGARIVPIVVRSGFDHPDSLFNDLQILLDQNRDEVLSLFSSDASASSAAPPKSRGSVAVLLVSYSSFEAVQAGSPIVLPQWFPFTPGDEVFVQIVDVAREASALLNAPEAQIGELCRLLWEMEGAILGALTVAAADKRNYESFFGAVRSDNERVAPDAYTAFLTAARNEHDDVQNPDLFRPSAARGQSLTGRLLRLVAKSSPSVLDSEAAKLAKAMNLSPSRMPDGIESLVAILLRSSERSQTLGQRVSRSVLLTVYAGCQYVTAAMHAGDYPPLPVHVLSALSFDLRKALDHQIVFLRSMSESVPPHA